MNTLTVITLLLLLALTMGFFEIFIPGGILGIIGIIFLFIAAIIALINYGLGVALLILAGGTVLGIGLFFIEIWILRKSPLGKAMVLEEKVEGSCREPQAGKELIGLKGTALTTLAPSGKVEINGQVYDGSSLSGFIDEGVDIEVVRINNFNVIVKES